MKHIILIIPFLLSLSCFAVEQLQPKPQPSPIVQTQPSQGQQQTPGGAQQTAKLLFKTKFGPGVSLGPIRGFSTFGAWQDLVGKDQATGFEFPAKNLQAYFTGLQFITSDPADPTTINKNVFSEIKSVPGPNGSPVNAFIYKLLIRPLGSPPPGKGPAQVDFLIARNFKSGDLKTLYIKYYFKFQKNLAESLHPEISSGNWRALFEYKTGGYQGINGQGDHRIQLTVLKNKEGKVYWMAKADSNANATFPNKDFWIYRNFDAVVPIDKWFKVEITLVRDAVNGKFKADIDGKNIFDIKASTMGEFNLPLTRLFVANSYSGGEVPIESTITDLEIWDKNPWKQQ